MDSLRKFLLLFLGFWVSLAVSVLVMINGWGLEPKSYWWIVGVGTLNILFAQMIVALASNK